jgi:hypothetical protein
MDMALDLPCGERSERSERSERAELFCGLFFFACAMTVCGGVMLR